MKEAWGCIEKSQMSLPAFVDDGVTLILNHKEYKPKRQNLYWNCPVKFVPDNVWGFLKMHNIIKTFPNIQLPPYDKINPRFLDAIYYYESKYNEYLSAKLEKNNG